MMQLKNMLRVRMAWVRAAGPHHEIVLSSRVRLARNLDDFPFPARATDKSFAGVLTAAFEASRKSRSLSGAALVRLDELERFEPLFLMERRLISSQLASEPKHRGVVVGEHELLSVMVNEEDHLRLQGVDSGLNLRGLHEKVSRLDDELSRELDFAYREDWGYLTACPTNTGTGLRASALVHLPGLALCGTINRFLDGLSRLGVVARGLFGEGTRVMGDLYQISNATTLGPSEARTIEDITKVVESLLDRERESRSELCSGTQRLRLEDLVHRSVGALSSARVITFEEALQHLSCVRLGLSCGWKLGVDLDTVNELIVLCGPAHIQMLAGKALEAGDRDFLRAALLRRKFK
jgi:protein arginine kinase